MILVKSHCINLLYKFISSQFSVLCHMKGTFSFYGFVYDFFFRDQKVNDSYSFDWQGYNCKSILAMLFTHCLY